MNSDRKTTDPVAGEAKRGSASRGKTRQDTARQDELLYSIDRYLEMARSRLAGYRDDPGNTVLLDMAIECAMSAVHGMYDIRRPLVEPAANDDYDE